MRLTRKTLTRGAMVAVAGTSAFALMACSGGGGGAASADSLSVLVNVENAEVPAVLDTLAAGACSEQAEAMPVEIETTPQTNLDQQLQLQAGQDALPVLFSAGNAPSLTAELAEAGHVADFEKVLGDLGIADQIEPAAVSTIESLYGGFNALPFEYNVEGIWYNKQLFADNGIDEPQTFDDMVTAAETLNAAGVQPFSASGEQG